MKYNNHWSVCGKEDITFRAHEACRDDFQHIVVSKRLMDHHNIVKVYLYVLYCYRLKNG